MSAPVADKNDAGLPEGFLGQCSGTLIHERVFLTAGHCVCREPFRPPFVFLETPVPKVRPARLARPGSLMARSANQSQMLIFGYGLLQEVPSERRFSDWDGLRRIRLKRLAQVVDDTWATWFLPGEVCDGDSGGAIFLDADRRSSELVAVVSYGGRQCRSASIHARLDTDAVQAWIRHTMERELR